MTKCPACEPMSNRDDILPGLRPLLVFPGVVVVPHLVFVPGVGVQKFWFLTMSDLARAAIADAMNVRPVDVEQKVSDRIVTHKPLFQHRVNAG